MVESSGGHTFQETQCGNLAVGCPVRSVPGWTEPAVCWVGVEVGLSTVLSVQWLTFLPGRREVNQTQS